MIGTKLLLIEDNPVERELITLMLEEYGFEVVALDTAIGCLNTIEAEKPALVLLDILMPELDGNEALQEIRKKHTQLELPVIMVSSKGDSTDVVESLRLGANDFITKPVHFDVAVRRIETHLVMGRQSSSLAHARELMAIHAMITTYNHEINNPLTVAMGHLFTLRKQFPEEQAIQKLGTALERIRDMVKKTEAVLDQGTVEYESYVNSTRMLKLPSRKKSG